MKICSTFIKIKVTPWFLILLGVVIAMGAMLIFTNTAKNLTFMSLSADAVESVVIHEQFGEQSAVLSQEDAEAVITLLQKIRLTGRSVRLYTAESINPCYTVCLRFGVTHQVAYYHGYYIVNGRGYRAEDIYAANGEAIFNLYLEQLSNREYFPRESGRE